MSTEPKTFLSKSAVLELFEISERTLKRDNKNGKIQSLKDERGWNWFAPSSLTVRYAIRPQSDTGAKISQTVSLTPVDTPTDTTQTVSKLEEKDKRIKELENQMEDLKTSMQDLRDDRDERKIREAKLLEIVEKQTLMLSAPEIRPAEQQPTMQPVVGEQPVTAPQSVPNLAPIKKQNWLSKMWNGDREKQRQRVANQTAKTGQDAPIQPASTS